MKRSVDVSTLIYLLMVYSGLRGVDSGTAAGTLLLAAALNAAVSARMGHAVLIPPSLIVASPSVAAIVQSGVLDAAAPRDAGADGAWKFSFGKPLVDPAYLEAIAQCVDNLVVEYRRTGRFTEIRAGATPSQIAELMVEADPSIASSILERASVVYNATRFDGSKSDEVQPC